MAIPKVTLAFNPAASAALAYQPLAPARAGLPAQAQVSFGVWVTNNESSTLTFESLLVQFSGNHALMHTFFGPESTTNVDSPDDTLTFAPGETKAVYSPVNHYFVIPQGIPTISLSVRFAGFETIKKDLPLVAHKNSVATGTYRWPASGLNLRPGEFWQGRSAAHWSGGNQLFAHDLGVAGRNGGSGPWSALLPGTDGTKNEHFRIWGKPVCAMADGTVVAFRDTQPTNPVPGVTLPGDSNGVLVQHGDEIASYLHFQPGTVNPTLKSIGAVVKAGMLLGLAGNSGPSSGPHLHVHAVKATGPANVPLPLVFRDIHTIAQTELPAAGGAGPWVRAVGQGLPAADSFVWPSPVQPGFRWEYLGGQFNNRPTVASWSPKRLDVFVRGTNNHLMHKWWTGTAWTGWEDLGGTLADAPAAVSWGPNRLDCFTRNDKSTLSHRAWNGSAWSAWSSLDDATFVGSPAVASWGQNRLDVFVRGTDSHLRHKWWNGTSWSPGWESLGDFIADSPAVVSWGPNRLDCFVRNSENTLSHRAWDGTSWSAWESFAGEFMGAPAVASRGENRLDVFVRGTNSHVMHKWWDGTSWSPGWESLGGALVDSPAAVSWDAKRLDCFVRGENSELWHRWWDGTAWSDIPNLPLNA